MRNLSNFNFDKSTKKPKKEFKKDYVKHQNLPLKYSIGSGPFCNASQDDCMPGYILKNKNSEGCWTGEKADCVFSIDEYKKTAGYKELSERMGVEYADSNIPSRFYVFGTAPFCSGSICDAVKARKWPIGTSKTANGATCLTGSKVIAIEPVAKYQFDKLDDLQEKCMASDDLGTQSWIEFWKTGGKIADAVTTVYTGVNPHIGDKVEKIDDKINTSIVKPSESKKNSIENEPNMKELIKEKIKDHIFKFIAS